MNRFALAPVIALLTVLAVVGLTYMDRRTGPAGGRPAFVALVAGVVLFLAALCWAFWGQRTNRVPAQAAVTPPSDTVYTLARDVRIPGRYQGTFRGVELWDMGDFTVRVRRVAP